MRLPANQLATLHAVAAAGRTSSSCWSTARPSSSATSRRTPRAGRRRGWAARRRAGRSRTCCPGRSARQGRLARDHPHRLEDNSSYLNFPGDSRCATGRELFIGYRGYDATRTDVAFPFGFGLSYTTFRALSDLTVATSGSVADGNLAADVTVTVANTGPVAGAESSRSMSATSRPRSPGPCAS